MKSLLNKIVATTALSTALLSSQAQVQEQKPLIHNVYANTSWNSKYLGGYGFSVSETPVIQSDLGFSIGKINYDMWSNFDIKRAKVTEIDNGFNTSFTSGNYTFTPSATHFTSPSYDFGDALELGLRVSRNDLPLNVSVFGANIFGKGIRAGQAFDLRAGKNIKLKDKLSASIQGDLWFNNHYFCNGSGFSHAAVKGSLNLDLGKGFSASVYGKIQKAIESHGGAFKDNSSYGLSINKNF